MRAVLRWSLAGTVALSIAALLWPKPKATVVQAAQRRQVDVANSAGGALAAVSTAAASLPVVLADWQIEVARRDPFAPYVPPVPTPPAVKTLAAPAIAVAPPPAPAQALPVAPGLNLRYLGAMVTPEGQRLVLLARGDVAVPVEVGMRLDEGYVVQGLFANTVRLVYPALGTTVDVPIPETGERKP